MMELLSGLTDDQKALVGCAAAVLFCGTLMSLSYYVGRLVRKPQTTPVPQEAHIIRMPEATTSETTIRRAA